MRYFVALLVLTLMVGTNGHGYLNNPPARNVVWMKPEFSWANPVQNPQPDEVWCGDVSQTEQVDNCGICGDPVGATQHHAKGGKYAKGIIVGNYTKGQIITMNSYFKVSHLGYFEFQLCTNGQTETELCFKQNVLKLVDGKSRYPITEWKENFNILAQVQLPSGVTCAHCVLRWIYRGGSFYEQCEDGSYDFGCGKQQTFVNCADISIR